MSELLALAVDHAQTAALRIEEEEAQALIDEEEALIDEEEAQAVQGGERSGRPRVR